MDFHFLPLVDLDDLRVKFVQCSLFPGVLFLNRFLRWRFFSYVDLVLLGSCLNLRRLVCKLDVKFTPTSISRSTPIASSDLDLELDWHRKLLLIELHVGWDAVSQNYGLMEAYQMVVLPTFMILNSFFKPLPPLVGVKHR